MSEQLKPRILIVADFPEWAYHNIAMFIQRNLSDEYDFYLDFACFHRRPEFQPQNTGISQRLKKYVRESIQKKRYLHVRGDKTYDVVLYLAYYLDTVAHFAINSYKIIKGIYTEGFPPQGMPNNYDNLNKIDFKDLTISRFVNVYLKNADALVCGAPGMVQSYSRYFRQVFFANSCHDENLFIPRKSERHDDPGKLVIGWTGTPDRPFKGFHSHVVPAVDRAKMTCPGITLKTRFSGSMKTLPLFYQDVDLVVIASEADAGPSLFMDAALSGIPAISTRIGLPAYVIRDGINGFFVDRDIDLIAEKILLLYNNRGLLDKMKSRIRNDFISLLGSKIQVENWKRIFHDTLGVS